MDKSLTAKWSAVRSIGGAALLSTIMVPLPGIAQGATELDHWLGYQTTTAPQLGPRTNPGEQKAQAAPMLSGAPGDDTWAKNFRLAPERLRVTPPDRDIELAQPLQIPLTLAAGKLLCISVVQRDHVTHEALANERAGVKKSQIVTCDVSDDGTSRMLKDEETAKVVEIVPLQLGQLDLEFSVQFADGGFSRHVYTVNVVPSSAGITSFSLNGGPAIAIVLVGKAEDRQVPLAPVAQYAGLKYPIYLNGFEQIQLSVEQPANEPLIRVDQVGLVHGLRPGKAIVVGHFGGLVDRLLVTVYTPDGAPAGYRRDPN